MESRAYRLPHGARSGERRVAADLEVEHRPELRRARGTYQDPGFLGASDDVRRALVGEGDVHDVGLRLAHRDAAILAFATHQVGEEPGVLVIKDQSAPMVTQGEE